MSNKFKTREEWLTFVSNKLRPVFAKAATPRYTERQAYDVYVKKCHSEIGVFVSEFNFQEWRAMGRPVSHRSKDGSWPTPWPNEEDAVRNLWRKLHGEGG